MKPAPFEYHRPTTTAEVLTLLEDLPEAELMAGNQSLGIIMASRLSTPEHVIDLNAIKELQFIKHDEKAVHVGAMTTHRIIERSGLLADLVPMLPVAARQIAGPSVRSRGTMGGSLGEADPAGNYPTVLVALNGQLNLRSKEGTREINADEYFLGYMFTDLRDHELIESVSIPTKPYPPERTGMAFEELKPASQTWPTISAAAVICVDNPKSDQPIVEAARVTLANAADVPLRVETAEEAIEDAPLTEESLAAAAAAATENADPDDELHADSEFKREVAGAYTRRALKCAYEEAIQT